MFHLCSLTLTDGSCFMLLSACPTCLPVCLCSSSSSLFVFVTPMTKNKWQHVPWCLLKPCGCCVCSSLVHQSVEWWFQWMDTSCVSTAAQAVPLIQQIVLTKKIQSDLTCICNGLQSEQTTSEWSYTHDTWTTPAAGRTDGEQSLSESVWWLHEWKIDRHTPS